MAINTQKASKTGLQPTATVALEQCFPEAQRIITDDLAGQLLTGMNARWVKWSANPTIRRWIIQFKEKFMPGGYSMFLVRKRYIDERLNQSLASGTLQSIVNLGAGMDTRLYRFPAAQALPCFELDQPQNISQKHAAIVRALGQFPSHITQVPINFIAQSIPEALASKKYNANLRTFFIWEAVSQYLDQKSVEATCDFLAKAPKDSLLVFTYVLSDFISGKNTFDQAMLYKMTVRNGLWRTGFQPDEIGPLLSQYGWQLEDELGYDELNQRYVAPTGRQLGVCAVERMAFARKL